MTQLEKFGDARRILGYAWLAVALYAVSFICLLLLSPKLVDPSGKPIGYDFITFWSAGKLALEGRAAAAFDMQAIFELQRAAVPSSDMIFLWHYPPTFQLVAALLALLPYLVSYFAFMALSIALYLLVMKKLLPWKDAGILLLAYPGVFICLLHGQNSLVSAALLGGAILALDRRPMLAGVCIGLLAYKPQLGALFPIVLALTGRWLTFLTAGATAGAFCALASYVFGVDIWAVTLANTGVIREVMETGQLPWAKMPSGFIFLRMLGAPQSIAYFGQLVVAFMAVAVVTNVWLRCGPTRLAGAALVCGTLMISPYTFDYEMAILAVPLAILAADLSASKRISSAEKLMLLALFVMPPLIGGIGEALKVQAGFPMLGMALWWTASRALAEARQRDKPAADWMRGGMATSVH